jgi:ABC-type branched-subunit amino acid transport system substrate-binding protein
MNAQFASISFLSSDAFAKDIGSEGAGTIVSQVMPSPADVSLPLVARFRNALQEYDSSLAPSYIALEGYLTGRLTIAALDGVSGEPTRAGLLAAIHGSTFDIDGVALTYGQSDNRGSSRVYLTVIDPDGSARPITSLREPHG